MYTPNLKPRIVIGPCSHEFWPASGWTNLRRNEWTKFYDCVDRDVVRRANIKRRPDGRWIFAVSEITSRGVICVAMQPDACVTTQPTQCMHAADLAACAVYGKREVSVSVNESGSVNKLEA